METDRFIKLSSAINVVEEVDGCHEKSEGGRWYGSIKAALDELPSEPVMPVLRCKDCRWWGTQGNEKEYTSTSSTIAPRYLPCRQVSTNPNWFCGSFFPRTKLDKLIAAIDCYMRYEEKCENCTNGYQMYDDSGDAAFWTCNEDKIHLDAYKYLKDYRDGFSYDPLKDRETVDEGY